MNVIQRLLGRVGDNSSSAVSGVSKAGVSSQTRPAPSSASGHPNREGEEGNRSRNFSGGRRGEVGEVEPSSGHDQQRRQSRGARGGGRGTARGKEIRRGGGRGPSFRDSVDRVGGAETGGGEQRQQEEKVTTVSVGDLSQTDNADLGNSKNQRAIDSRKSRQAETGGARRQEGRGGRQGVQGRGGQRGHGRGQPARRGGRGDAVTKIGAGGEEGQRSSWPLSSSGGEGLLRASPHDEKLFTSENTSGNAELPSKAFSETSRPSTTVPPSPLDSSGSAATPSTTPPPGRGDDSGGRGSDDYSTSVSSSLPPSSSCVTSIPPVAAHPHRAVHGGGGGGGDSSDTLSLASLSGPGTDAQSLAMKKPTKAIAGGGGAGGTSGGVRQGGAKREGGRTAMKLEDELPIMKYKQVILQHIRDHPVTCIQGETGCGKSTRVPRFLLEEDLEEEQKERMGSSSRGETTQNGRRNILPFQDASKDTSGGEARRRRRSLNAIVTQPRRLACIALARRVAQEFDEPLGKSVGFRISGDSCVSKSTKVCFVTTGYFLQILINQPHALSSLTHVILDEVHERDLDADLLSLVLKLQLRHRGGLKLIVMSATLQGNLFAEYFTPYGVPVSPRIYVGARRFPVQHLFLDDLCHGIAQPSTLRGEMLGVHDLTGNTALLMEGRDEEEEAEGGDWSSSSSGRGKGKFHHGSDLSGSNAWDSRGGKGGGQGAGGGGGLQVNLVKAMLDRKAGRGGDAERQPQRGNVNDGVPFSWKSLKALKDVSMHRASSLQVTADV